MDMSRGYHDIVEHFILSEYGIFLGRSIDYRGPQIIGTLDNNTLLVTIFSKNLSNEQMKNYFNKVMEKHDINPSELRIGNLLERISDSGIEKFPEFNSTLSSKLIISFKSAIIKIDN